MEQRVRAAHKDGFTISKSLRYWVSEFTFYTIYRVSRYLYCIIFDFHCTVVIENVEIPNRMRNYFIYIYIYKR